MTVLHSGNTWRSHEGARAGLLVDGCDYYRAFWEAARHAKKSILLLGWQFDSDVRLLRGDDLPRHTDPERVELLAFLDDLCRANPNLEVRILAWDHSLVFAFERELLQKVLFDVSTCERFHFHWDATVPLGGSHHQKVAIVDGRIAFTGSQDLAQERWDDSRHLADQPLRVTAGGLAYKPYHEVQTCLTGGAARSLVDLFADRWRGATGKELDIERLIDDGDGVISDVPVTLAMPEARVSFARTVPAGPSRDAVQEVRDLYIRAIERAERLVYIETQYLTSCAVRRALVERMSDRSRSKLDVVVMLPKKPERFKEEFTVGLPQAETLWELASCAREHGHRFGVYNVASGDTFVYIHAKLMVVDDCFLTVGSANLTNRSMTIDSEINVTWEAKQSDLALRNAIRRLRVRLLTEHVGGSLSRALVRPEGLVSRLDAHVVENATRLRHHEVHQQDPSVIAKAVQELACEVLDPPSAA